MRTSGVVLGLLACFHQASAVCLRSNKCLKAIGQLGAQGVADCSANLAVIITSDLVTFTETASTATDYQTIVVTQIVTATETTTAWTETDWVIVSRTVTPSTETQVQFVTRTAVTTDTSTRLVTVTPSYIPWRRAATSSECSPTAIPTYPLQCLSWEKYTAACRCANVTPITVTVEAPSTTVTVGVAGTVTNSIFWTLIRTDIVLQSVTATTVATMTNVVSLTVTTLETRTVVLDKTVTKEITQATAAPLVPGIPITSNVGAFRAVDTDRFWYLDVFNVNSSNGALTGPAGWRIAVPTSTRPKWAPFLWNTDDQGRVLLRSPRWPSSVSALYVSTSDTSRTLEVSVASFDTVQAWIRENKSVSWVYGAVDPVTNQLYLRGAGRRNILSCGSSLYLSSGTGPADIASACTVMHPIYCGCTAVSVTGSPDMACSRVKGEQMC